MQQQHAICGGASFGRPSVWLCVDMRRFELCSMSLRYVVYGGIRAIAKCRGRIPRLFFLGIELARDLSTFVDESGDRGGRALKTGAGRTKGYLLRIVRSACIRLASLLGGKWPNLTDMRSGAGVSRVARKRILVFCWRGFPCVGKDTNKTPGKQETRSRWSVPASAYLYILAISKRLAIQLGLTAGSLHAWGRVDES